MLWAIEALERMIEEAEEGSGRSAFDDLNIIAGVAKAARDYREALEQIAYPGGNWPGRPMPNDNSKGNELRRWMQSVAANALTNGGR